MTRFGVQSCGESPAYRRMVAIGLAFAERKRRDRVASPAQRREALRIRLVMIKAKRQRAAALARAAEVERLRKQREGHPLMRAILDYVCERTGLPASAILGSRGSRATCAARQECCWLCRLSGRSYEEIGRFLRRNHSTVMHNIQVHEKRVREGRA